MLKIYHSNRLEALLPHLARELVEAPQDPFQPEVILVQNPGMAQWLKLQLASMFSLAANIEFPLPSTFIWRIFRQVLEDLPERSAFVKEAMVWKLMALLPGLLEEKDFQPLKHYLHDDVDQRKLYQLAEKIADNFDQYLVYRPEWINAWEQGKDLSKAEEKGQAWQALLWRALVEQAHAMGQSPFHRARLFSECETRLASKNVDLSAFPQRLIVFGITTLAPNYLKVLEALSAHIDIHMMVFNPCMHYWGDVNDPGLQAKMQPVWQNHNIETAGNNPLLASMAQQGRDYLDLLHECKAIDVDAFINIDGVSLLQLLQQDVLRLNNRGGEVLEGLCPADSQHKTVIASQDRSLLLYSCYSAVREVEVLQQHLLALFDENPEITPKDIVVMMADVDSYTPYIQAVFGNATQSQYIPWSISDRSIKAENPLVTAFLSLLQLPVSRFPVSELLDLLAVPAIARRLDINEDEVNKIEQWVRSAGIRWGLSASSKQQLQLPETEQNTWAFGLKRLLLGYAMAEQQGVFAQVMPFDGVEGGNAQTLGKLINFVEKLEDSQRSLKKERSCSQWLADLHALLDSFFLPKQDEEFELQGIRELVGNLAEQIETAGFNETLTHAVMVDALRSELMEQKGGQRFLAGQVNFCTLMPMRSIPFKVVCLLGMNDGVYPRNVLPLGFDLMAGDYRKGDRSRRDDDRYLFLEALLSARQKLIISYQGRSIRDSSEKMPSVLVSELLEYCQQGFVLSGDEYLPAEVSAKKLLAALRVEHPLQAFSNKYFFAQTGTSQALFSYSQEWLKAAQCLSEQSLLAEKTTLNFCSQPLSAQSVEEKVTDEAYLELNHLIRFFCNPAQYFMNHRLGVYFHRDDDALLEDEPFELDALQNYQLKQAWLFNSLDGGEAERFMDEYQLRGVLPVGAFGRQRVEQAMDDVSLMISHLKACGLASSDALASYDVQIPLSDCVLAGRIRQLGRVGLLHFRPSEFKGKDKIQLWINHLALCADKSLSPQPSRFVGKKAEYQLQPLDADLAREKLQTLLEIYRQGQQQALLFIPETSYAAYNPDYATEDKRLQAINKAWQGNRFPAIPGEGSNLYVDRCFGESEEWPAEFFELAEQVFSGFHELLEERDLEQGK